MSTTKTLLALVFISLPLAAVGCGRSEEDVQKEFDAFVAEANACQQDADCVLVSPGCPLGCFVAVSSAKKAEVEEKARELIDEYQAGGQRCDYDCIAPGAITCAAGRCQVGSSL
jgi:hypothetical protein